MPEVESKNYFDAAMHTSFSRRRLLGLGGAGVGGVILAACGSNSKANPTPTPTEATPVVLSRPSERIGGNWISPPDGAVFTTPEVRACAVPERGKGAPPIAHVDFTVDSLNPDDPGWHTEVSVKKPNNGAEYCANINLKKKRRSYQPQSSNRDNKLRCLQRRRPYRW